MQKVGGACVVQSIRHCTLDLALVVISRLWGQAPGPALYSALGFLSPSALPPPPKKENKREKWG